MRKPLLLFPVSLAVAWFVVASPAAQQPAPAGYLTPPKVIADIMDAEPLPDGHALAGSDGAACSPIVAACRRLRRSPCRSSASPARASIHGRTDRACSAAPSASRSEMSPPAPSASWRFRPPDRSARRFSPDGKHIGITHTTDSSIRLLVADVATGAGARPSLDGGVNGLAGGCTWRDDSTGFLCRLIPDGPRRARRRSRRCRADRTFRRTLAGRRRAGPIRTLLTSPYDEQLYDYYYTSQPTWVDARRQRKTPFGKPAVYQGVSRPPTASGSSSRA